MYEDNNFYNQKNNGKNINYNNNISSSNKDINSTKNKNYNDNISMKRKKFESNSNRYINTINNKENNYYNF